MAHDGAPLEVCHVRALDRRGDKLFVGLAIFLKTHLKLVGWRVRLSHPVRIIDCALLSEQLHLRHSIVVKFLLLLVEIGLKGATPWHGLLLDLFTFRSLSSAVRILIFNDKLLLDLFNELFLQWLHAILL